MSKKIFQVVAFLIGAVIPAYLCFFQFAGELSLTEKMWISVTCGIFLTSSLLISHRLITSIIEIHKGEKRIAIIKKANEEREEQVRAIIQKYNKKPKKHEMTLDF